MRYLFVLAAVLMTATAVAEPSGRFNVIEYQENGLTRFDECVVPEGVRMAAGGGKRCEAADGGVWMLYWDGSAWKEDTDLNGFFKEVTRRRVSDSE